MIKITWFGHACFGVTKDDYSMVIDPYDPGNGRPQLNLEANEVLVSHTHGDHNYLEGVKLTAKADSPFKTYTVDSFHDKTGGADKGRNLIHVIEAEGKKLVHLGDLGHLLGAEELEKIGKVDVLMIPVGGYYTIDAAEAKEIINKLNPKVVIPMHYAFSDGAVIAKVDDFLKLMSDWEIDDTDSSEYILEDGAKKIVVMKPEYPFV